MSYRYLFACTSVCLLTSACGDKTAAVGSDATTQSDALSAQWGNSVQLSAAWGGAYPRLVRLADSSLLGTVTSVQNGINHLRVVHSTNNGASFADYGEIAEGVGDIDNTQTVQLDYTAPGAAAPRILAAFRNHSRDANGNYTIFRITVCRSDDGGKSWVFHSQVDSSTPPNGLWEPFLFKAPDGSLQVYYARENASNDQDIVMRRSSDNGVTWGGMQTVAGAGITSRDGMPGVTTYFDGTHVALLAIFESESGGIFHVMSVKSTDSGVTWTQRSTVYAPAPGKNAGSPQIATVGGQLVAIFMTDEDASQQNWPNQAAVKTVASDSIGSNNIAWSAPNTIATASAYWPGIVANNDKEAFFTFNASMATGPVSTIGGSSTGNFKLVNPQSGLCLDISGGSGANGTAVQLWNCNNLDPQRYTFVDAGEGYFALHNHVADSCLDVTAISTTPGADIQEWACWGGANQLVRFEPNGDGTFSLIFKNSGLCLDSTADGTAPGTRIEQWTCNNGPAQKWSVQAN